MCGGFVIAIGLHDQTAARAIQKQLAYSLGRCFTYASLGALLGGVGKKLVHEFVFLENASALLAILAGVAITYLGIANLTGFSITMKLREWSAQKPKKHSCISASLFKDVFQNSGRGTTGAFIAGLATGFLPCGLLYGMLSIAAASQSVTRGAMVMVVFGIGTSPALMTLGVIGRTLTLKRRGQLYQAAAVSLLLAGALTCIRGVWAWEQSGTNSASPKCPLCATAK